MLLLLGVLVLVGAPVATYFADKKGLREFPSPSVAGFTPLWSWWHNYKFKRFMAIHKAHEKLGAVVRIEPNHCMSAIHEASPCTNIDCSIFQLA